LRSISAGDNLVTFDMIAALTLLEKAEGKPAELAFPSLDLLRRFVSDLSRRGLPASRISDLSQPGLLSGSARATVGPGDAYPVATDTGRAP
jgi:hypothetical protein